MLTFGIIMYVAFTGGFVVEHIRRSEPKPYPWQQVVSFLLGWFLFWVMLGTLLRSYIGEKAKSWD